TLVLSQLDNVWTFTRASTAVSVMVQGRVRFNAAEGIRAAVLADMGLAIASDWMFAPELAAGSVVRVLEKWTLPDIALWAVF
ncbi:LysR substrate-binding domain-containing protein, partial [Acinetobacter baumannii]